MLMWASLGTFIRIKTRSLKQHYVTLTTNRGFEKRNSTMHGHTSHKTALLVKLGHILCRKCSLVFPLMSYCLQPFILAGLSPATTRCCSCCFSRQAAYMLLSGTSVNHRAEAELSQDIRGKTRGLSLHKIWPGFTKIAVLYDVSTCIVKFCFSKPRVAVKVT